MSARSEPARAPCAESREAVSHSGAQNSRRKRLFAALALLAAGFVAARHVATWPAKLRYPGELDVVEGRALADMLALREKRLVYAPATPERYNSAEYGPFYFLLGSRLVDPEKPAFFPLRALAALGTLGLAVGCGLLAFWLARSWFAAILGPLLFLSYAFTTYTGVVIRCDTVALLLWFGGFLVAYRFQGSRKILLALPLMILGVFYKGQFLAAFLAILLFLFLERRFRLAAEFAALLFLGSLSLFLVFEFLVFPRQAFWLHVLVYNVIPLNSVRASAYALLVGLVYVAPVLAAVQFLRAHPNKLLSCYLGWAVLLPLLTLGKPGSSMNYSFELLLGVCSIFAAVLAGKIDTTSRAVPLLCLLGITLWTAQFPKHEHDPSPLDFAEDATVQAYLRKNFPPHSAALGVFTGDLLRAGLDAPIANLYQYTWLICNGRLPEEGLLQQLRNGRFRIILVDQDIPREKDLYELGCVTEPLRQAIIQNYRLDATFHFHLFNKINYYAWVPRRAAGM